MTPTKDNYFGITVDTSAGLIYSVNARNSLVVVNVAYSALNNARSNPTSPALASGAVVKTIGGFNQPRGVWLDNLNRILVADTANFVIKQVENPLASSPTITVIAGVNQRQGLTVNGAVATSARLFNPFAGWTDTSGNHYIVDFQRCIVQRFTTGGTISNFFGTSGTCGNTPGLLNKPRDISGDNAGNLYVTEFAGGQIRQIPTNGGPSVVLVSGLSEPRGIIFMSSSPLSLVFVDKFRAKRFRVGSPIQDIPVSSVALLNSPQAVCFWTDIFVVANAAAGQIVAF